MRAVTHSVLLLGLVIGLAACGGDDDDDPVVDNGNQAVNFTAFVKTQLAADPDGREPASLNNRTFRQTDQDNPNAYDDILSSSN